MIRIVALLALSGCLTSYENTIGGDGLGVGPDIGYVFRCDLDTQIDSSPVVHLLGVEHPCFEDLATVPGTPGAPALDAYVQRWTDSVCMPAIARSGYLGGCYGECAEDPHNPCFL